MRIPGAVSPTITPRRKKSSVQNSGQELVTFLTQDPRDVGVLLEHEVEYKESSLASLLHKKLQEVKDLDEQLAAMKESCAERARIVKEAEKRFAKKQSDMKKSIAAFEKYITDSDSKRIRAIRKTTEQRKIRESKELQLEKLKEQLSENNTARGVLLERLGHLKRYENYLSEVVKSESQWHNIDEILNRYRVLVTAHSDLSKSASEGDALLEECQAKFQKLFKEKTNEVLMKNSQVAQCMKVLEDSSAVSQCIEAESVKLDETTIGIASRIVQVQMSTHNLYSRVLQSYEQRRPKTIEPDPSILDPNQQSIDHLTKLLNEIGDRLIEVDSIQRDQPTGAAGKLNQTIDRITSFHID